MSVLQAPGGYGKSTLAAQFAADVEFQARWLNLDSSSQAPDVFAEQVVTAVLGGEAWRPASVEGDGALAAYLGAAFREFDEASPLPLLLVLDNAHELNPSEEARELLAWLLQSLPAGSEVMILSREPLPLPDLDRQLAGGDALLLTAADLAFSAEETAAVLETGGAGSPGALAVHEATGGWPVAVRGVVAGTLALESAGRAVAGGAWERYLASEVWAAVPGELRTPLMRAAIPLTAETDLIAPLFGPGEWEDLARWLDELDFFVEHDAQGGRRLNPVVQRFLRERFRSVDALAFGEAVDAVAHELESQRRVIDAIELAMNLRAPATLRGLLAGHAAGLLQRGSFASLQRSLSALNDMDRLGDDLLAGIHARVEAQVGNPEVALTMAASLFDAPATSIESRHHARLARARSLRMLGRMDEVGPTLDVPLDDLPSDRGMQAEFAWHRAHASFALSSNFDRALELLDESLRAADDTANPLLALLCRSTIGQVLAMKGDGPASVTALSEAARGWREQQGSAHLAWVLNNLGMAHIMVGDMESAISSLTEAREQGVIAHNRRAEAFAVASLGDAYLASGDPQNARNCYEATIEMCAENPIDQSLVVMATAGLAGAVLDTGDVGRADFVVRRAVDMSEELGNPFELASCLLQQAAVESASELHSAAVTHARRAVELLDSIGAEAALRVARYRLALVYFRDGDRESAEEVVDALNPTISAPWMARGLQPLLREHPLFAQWVDQRASTGRVLRETIRAFDFAVPDPPAVEEVHRFPRVIAQSLGALRVIRDGQEVTDEAWESARARELFYLFLARPEGVRKEEAFEELYPDLPASRCNSQFHTNLYRVRKALYKESIVKRDGAYILNPEGDFDWDVSEFQSLLERAGSLPAGSTERAAAYERAMQLYRGPFAEAFFSEWAASLRDQLARKNVEVLASLGGYYAGRKDFEAAASCMEQVLKSSQFNDEAAALLAIYRSRAGQSMAALAFLDDYRAGMERELEEPLPPRLQKLRHAIASGTAV